MADPNPSMKSDPTEATQIVIAAGTVAESGPPDELLASGGMFAQLAAREEL